MPLCESYVSVEQYNDAEPFYPLRVFVYVAAIGVLGEELVRRVDLDHADAEVQDAADLVTGVRLGKRIHRADRQQPIDVRA